MLLGVVALTACAGGRGASSSTRSTAPAPAPPLLVADPSTSNMDPAAIWLPSAVTQPPVAVSRPRVVVPDSVTRQGLGGSVALEYVVDTLGRVERASIRVLSSDHPALVAPARAMVAGMRYRPGRVHGRAVRVQVGTRIRIGAGAP